MKKQLVYLFSCLIIVQVLLFYPYQLTAQPVDSTLSIYAEKYGQERMYLHYDKSSYTPGETIWFKAYIMEGFAPAEASKTLYIDWIDNKGTVLLHSVCPVLQSATNGQFDIPEAYTDNTVHVRAYTKWMLNFDTAFLYKKELRIIAKNPLATSASKATSIPTLHFFPEGGDVITGVKNKIAFKAADQWGRPVAVKGVIQNSKGVVVDSLRTIHDGMGYFFLLPQTGESFKAKWNDGKGAEQTTNLPAVKPEGVSMQVTVSGTRRLLVLNRTNPAPEHFKTLHVVGTMHQNQVFKTDINLATDASATKTIPTESLPTGILTITAFDANWNALAERITYVKNQDYSFPVEMNVQHWGLNKRARNEVQITVPENIQASLSVSVTDAALERDTAHNIISHLLLTSDIKGVVHRPSYYFSSASHTTDQHLDLVMLTHGWRRFKWEDVVKGKFPSIKYPRDTAYLALSGKVVGVTKNQLSSGGTVILIVKQRDSASKIMMVPVTQDGNFADPAYIFFDTLQVYYQFQKNKPLHGAEIRFMNERLAALNYNKNLASLNPFRDTTGSYRQYTLAEEQARLRELLSGKTLENVTVRATTKSAVQVLDDKYTSGMFKGSDAVQFDLLNDPTATSFFNIFQYLQGRVAGLQITSGAGGTNMQWRGGTPQLYLDEIRTDADMISNIPVADVAYIKVFRPPFMGGFGGSNGAIAIYTRRGGDVQNTPGRGLGSHIVTGYTPVRQFYAPNYRTFTPSNEQRDVRTTLYWNPFIKASPQKRVITLSFYNNDVSDAFRVVIEGMSSDGRLTHLEQIME